MIINPIERSQVNLMPIERFSFYGRAQKAYAIVATGCVHDFHSRAMIFLSSEMAPYGNIILKKGLAIEI